MSPIKLSICIPTYNRAAFLQKLLIHFKNNVKFEFPFEIVVSDNASTDATQAVVEDFIGQGLPIRYYRRTTNGGGWPNLANAFLHAKGEYATYLADDDLPIFEGIVGALDYLQKNPDVIACYAPWFLHDEVAGRDLTQFYHVRDDVKFPHRSFPELFRFIFEGHIFPEIGIYKTSALRSAYVPREFCFWAFSHLAHFVDIGAVAFLRRPFYRSVTRSTVARDSAQAGNDEVMTGWDRYRGGLEYFLYLGAKRGRLNMGTDQRLKYDEMCKIFTLNRMAVALRFWIARKEFIKAYELYVRLAFGGLASHEEVKKVQASLPLMVAVQTFVQQINATSGICRVVLSNVDDVVALTGLLYELGLDRQVKVMGEPGNHAADLLDQTIVFTARPADRDKFIALGYLPNLVFCENDLTDEVIV